MLLYVSYFRFLLDSFNLEKCTLSLCSWTLLSVYVWNHVLLFEYLKLVPCNFFWGGSKGESEVAAHVLTSSRQLFSGLQCLNLSQPSYWVPVTLELLVLLKSSQMPGCFLLHDCAPITWKGAFFLCDLVHFFLINSLLWLETTWRIEIVVTMTPTRPASS